MGQRTGLSEIIRFIPIGTNIVDLFISYICTFEASELFFGIFGLN